MKLIKLGAAYLNMDMVTDVWVDQGRVTVFFAVPAMYSAAPFREVTHAITTREIRFSGAEAEALIGWLAKRAKDLMPGNDGVREPDVPETTNDVTVPEYENVDDSPMS